jgi:hypothetical protein
MNPWWYAADRDLARRIITVQNEKTAEWCARPPGSFRGDGHGGLAAPSHGGRAPNLRAARRRLSSLLPRPVGVDFILSAPFLSDSDKEAILGGNLIRMLRTPA